MGADFRSGNGRIPDFSEKRNNYYSCDGTNTEKETEKASQPELNYIFSRW